MIGGTRRRSRRGTVVGLADDELTVTHLPDEGRYELRLDGVPVGELVYRSRSESVVAFVHTEVDPTTRRRGLGSALVAAALDDARQRGLHVLPVCPFVDAYVRRHPEYADLVVDDPARRA
jgi:predicted GNAT family acetyltransferase